MQTFLDLSVTYRLQCGLGSCERWLASVVGPRKRHSSLSRGGHLHHLAQTHHGAEREPVCYCLREDRDVWLHAVELLRASRCHPEASDDLVEDQQDVVLLGYLLQLVQVAFPR